MSSSYEESWELLRYLRSRRDKMKLFETLLLSPRWGIVGKGLSDNQRCHLQMLGSAACRH